MQPALQDILNAWYTIVTSNASNPSPGGLFNYFASTSTPPLRNVGMTEYSGQDLSNVSKWLAVQTYISDHWPNSPLGPNCSFVQDQTADTAYGCFRATGENLYVCARSEDGGKTWTNLPSLDQSSSACLTLDGYDVTQKKLYARVTDRTYVNTYHVYSEVSREWTAMPNFQYFAGLYSSAVLPRIPTGADQSFNQGHQCKTLQDD